MLGTGGQPIMAAILPFPGCCTVLALHRTSPFDWVPYARIWETRLHWLSHITSTLSPDPRVDPSKHRKACLVLRSLLYFCLVTHHIMLSIFVGTSRIINAIHDMHGNVRHTRIGEQPLIGLYAPIARSYRPTTPCGCYRSLEV